MGRLVKQPKAPRTYRQHAAAGSRATLLRHDGTTSHGRIAFVLKQAEDGSAVTEVCRKAGISEATFYNWRKKYAGLMPSEMKRLRQLEEEISKLKQIVADLSLDKAMLQDVLSK
ncbi:putative transposase [Rhodopseudomonas rhenobacensis]|uniref:Putative transposase n=1 Tax=Rhodopseudomonas rhenobacensis TaxID=87461 RepID=A0A7W7Z278_9BRAD|nr:putative transposase [Rhodopseudomonas rhenobacensis]